MIIAVSALQILFDLDPSDIDLWSMVISRVLDEKLAQEHVSRYLNPNFQFVLFDLVRYVPCMTLTRHVTAERLRLYLKDSQARHMSLY